MEALSRLLSKAVLKGLVKGFSVESPTGTAIGVSHLLYANDTLVFCDANAEQVGFLHCVLLCFKAVSGLRINLSKSRLIPVGEVERLPVVAVILGCKVATLPMTYLGLLLGATFKATGVWDRVVERVQRCLAGWKQQYLSKGGMLTLIKSVLSSIPTYFMSLHVILASVVARLQKLQRDFLWGDGGEDFKYHLVDWRRICQPKEVGGLGVRSVVQFNRALLGKWLWRFVRERDRLWRRVVASKFGVVAGD
ncbi:uncharacterized protein LOC114299299 [Camellia sinensis]|uniref:uncharacterized protein LOC114299299 n=1 Tax=Camellia sinensis TaxID=4442 RepID=UPI001036803F|nr:uncharacterized protein LOC114299299 [Camellia sinensis]